MGRSARKKTTPMKNDPVMEQCFKLEVSGRDTADGIISWYDNTLNLPEIDQQIN